MYDQRIDRDAHGDRYESDRQKDAGRGDIRILTNSERDERRRDYHCQQRYGTVRDDQLVEKRQPKQRAHDTCAATVLLTGSLSGRFDHAQIYRLSRIFLSASATSRVRKTPTTADYR